MLLRIYGISLLWIEYSWSQLSNAPILSFPLYHPIGPIVFHTSFQIYNRGITVSITPRCTQQQSTLWWGLNQLPDNFINCNLLTVYVLKTSNRLGTRVLLTALNYLISNQRIDLLLLHVLVTRLQLPELQFKHIFFFLIASKLYVQSVLILRWYCILLIIFK